MQSSKIGLQKWVIAMYLMPTNLKGVSSMKLHRDLGVTQKTAWFMAQKIRQGWLESKDDKLDGVVEVDETYIGGKSRNMHAKERKARKQYKKETVVGILERDGDVRVAHIEKEDAPEPKRSRGRPVKNEIEMIPDTAPNIARAIFRSADEKIKPKNTK